MAVKVDGTPVQGLYSNVSSVESTVSSGERLGATRAIS